MRILYVVPFVPWPARVRSHNLIPRLAQRHSIDLICAVQSETDLDRLEAMQDVCSTVRYGTFSLPGALVRCALALPTPTPLRIAYVSSKSMRAAVKKAMMVNRPDVIYCERWRALQYIPQDCDVPIVCDPTDSMLLYNRRARTRGHWWEKLAAVEEAFKFRKYEPWLARQVDAAVYCSSVDLDAIRQLARDANLAVIGNGVDTRKYHVKNPSEEECGLLVFTGSFTYSPNRWAVEWFLENVFPLVLRAVPSARLSIVGNQARRHLSRWRDSKAVEIRDFVPDLRPFIAAATVSIAPIQVGVGVTNKVLEAFATGTAVVATSVACGDLPVRDGEHLLLANDSIAFANATVRLLEDASLRERITAAARSAVEQEFEWDVIVEKLEELMKDVAGKRLRRPAKVGQEVMPNAVSELMKR